MFLEVCVSYNDRFAVFPQVVTCRVMWSDLSSASSLSAVFFVNSFWYDYSHFGLLYQLFVMLHYEF